MYIDSVDIRRVTNGLVADISMKFTEKELIYKKRENECVITHEYATMIFSDLDALYQYLKDNWGKYE